MPEPAPTRRAIPMERPRNPRAWEWAGYVVLAGTLALVAILFWRPDPALRWTWNVVVPLLPATFLVTPALWRNLCPLATLNELPQRLGRRGRLPPAWWSSGGLAVIALFLLVPARRALLNTEPEATALAIAGLAVAAIGLGGRFAARSGFCNSICPILPVERLYGQRPLVELRGSRCASCTFCTPTGCMDLARDKAMAQVLGRARHSARWLVTPMGIFGAVFPGIVIAYFTSADLAAGPALDPWLRAAVFGTVSYAVVGGIALATRLKGGAGMLALGALSFALYYWFAAIGLADTLGLGLGGRVGARILAGGLLAWWLWRARGSGPTPRRRPANQGLIGRARARRIRPPDQ